MLSRAGKVKTATRYWYNVQVISGACKSLNLEAVSDWRQTTSEEEVNVIMIPKDKQNNQECIKAKADELQKLLDFDVYMEVDDKGQDCISTTWVVTKNGEQVKARLVVRGFEEVEEVEKDSPTVAKSTMRILMSVAVSKGWTVKGTDIKSAFLQGKKIKRNVYIKLPCEAKRPAGKLWKLKKTLYGLNDAARKFYDSIREELTNLALVQSKMILAFLQGQ